MRKDYVVSSRAKSETLTNRVKKISDIPLYYKISRCLGTEIKNKKKPDMLLFASLSAIFWKTKGEQICVVFFFFQP